MLIVVALIAVQMGVSFVVRTHRMRGYLVAHLESAFGRPVEVGSLSVQILPMPELDVEGVTISEDPAFGYEYFLRAEHMTASLRWFGLLRGHFQFGTMSLTRPSLILVRNADGRWNLEDWLPPARQNPSRIASVAAPQAPVSTRLQKIEFDDGRINFKLGDDKQPFAFTGVSGSVEQVAEGRWRLRLEAQPWRSGITLQSTGTIQVAGDVAGTSARLQPAQLRIHWARVSMADLFRLVTGNDPGVRGEFALDGDTSAGTGSEGEPTPAGQWRFNIKIRGTQIHRWDLTERSDNPRVNVNLMGVWDIAAGEARAEEVRVESPRSNMTGSLLLQTKGAAAWRGQFKSTSISGQDLLAWYRAFQPELAPEVTFDEWITGRVSASGWPLRWEEGEIEGTAGTLRVPEIVEARIGALNAVVRRGKFTGNVRLAMANAAASQSAREKAAAAKSRGAIAAENGIEILLVHDSVTHQGGLTVNLRMSDVTPLFKLTAAFGHPLNRGWDYKGEAAGSVRWNWEDKVMETRRTGTVDLTKAQLEVAGLNQPLKVEEARLEWNQGLRSATITKLDGFGAAWSGTIAEEASGVVGEPNRWRFQLHADHLDAAEFDRWFGPRARPNWLRRLVAPLLGESKAAGQASELLRRISAEGELSADALSIEKIKLTKAHATLGLQALQLEVRDAEAQWAGGTVRGGLQAAFSSQPKYEVNAEIAHVNLAQLPWPPKWAERWSGLASGSVHLTTSGVGREQLLKQLAGSGQLNLSQVELRGWDVESSAESGTLRGGTSRWSNGQGEFEVGERAVHFTAIRLEAPHARTQLAGSIGFDMDGSLTFTPGSADKRGKRTASALRELRVKGPFEAPTAEVQPVSAAGPGL